MVLLDRVIFHGKYYFNYFLFVASYMIYTRCGICQLNVDEFQALE